MSDIPQRQLVITLEAKDANGVVSRPSLPEQVHAALVFLEQVLAESEREGATLTTKDFGGISPSHAFTSGLELAIAGWQALDSEAKTEIALSAVRLIKRILPVRCEWDVFDADGKKIGMVPEWMSQHEAGERTGILG
jgi:hypothetical protein